MVASGGLTDDQIADRVNAGLTNHVSMPSSRTLGHILRANVLTLFNGVVVGSAVLLLLLGQWKDAIFGIAAIANAVIGVGQEYRAKRMLDRLALFNAPLTTVLRNGVLRQIPMANIVLDDVVVLRSGDQVPADSVVVSAQNLEIDESLLTGESNPVAKGAHDDVLSGSTVLAGHGRVRVVRVGLRSFATRMTMDAKRFSLVNSELRNEINRVLRWISWALFPIIAIVVNGQMQAQGGWTNAIRTGAWRQAADSSVAGVISTIPVGLVLMTSIAFAVGAVRLARRNVLVQELAAVEGLARVDIVCFDKTGTLTEGDIGFEAAHEIGVAADPGWQLVLGWFAADDNANATARSLRPDFPDAETLHPASTVSFSSSRKWSAVSFAEGVASGLWVLGAPEEVLAGSAANAAVLRMAMDLSASGLRTLVLAHSVRPMTVAEAAEELLPQTLKPAVVVTLHEKVRPDAARTLAYLREQGLGLRVISGDSPSTVAAVAREVGLEFDGDGYDARYLPEDPEEMAAVLGKYSVFGRVTPSQKKDMVLALQRKGHVVAMTGDGVNDALAVKQADIGIAMGSGAAATRAVSRLVLLDGEFAHLPNVIAEGRQVIANVERVSMLFLTKTVYAVVLSIIFGVFLWKYPFLPRQLSASDGLTIGIPAFFLALMPNSRRFVPGFLRRALSFAIPAGLVVSAVVLAVSLYAEFAHHSPSAVVGVESTIALSLVALWVLVVLARPLNRWRVLLIAAMYAGLLGIATVPFIRSFLGFAQPPLQLLAMSFAAALLGSIGIELIHRVLKRRP